MKTSIYRKRMLLLSNNEQLKNTKETNYKNYRSSLISSMPKISSLKKSCLILLVWQFLHYLVYKCNNVSLRSMKIKVIAPLILMFITKKLKIFYKYYVLACIHQPWIQYLYNFTAGFLYLCKSKIWST